MEDFDTQSDENATVTRDGGPLHLAGTHRFASFNAPDGAHPPQFGPGSLSRQWLRSVPFNKPSSTDELFTVPIVSTKVPQTRTGQWWEAHPSAMRLLAVIALLWGGTYLGYRLVVTGRGANPVAFGVLWYIEFYNFISLAFLIFFGWRWSESTRPVATSGYSVDVFVTTYNEPLDVLEATLAGCAALTYPHKTYLLDDGRRPNVADLARAWSAHYITRPDNTHAKAGNINHALGYTNGDLIFCLDADHVPLPDALTAVVGYFDDEKVGLVQSPHDFYNQDSVQHYEIGRHEQSLFFEVVCPGKDRHNGVFWCGSAAVLRRAALVDAGGVSTETIAEDFHSTVKMHRKGWKTRYHDEVLVQGLAPLDLDGYLLQRDRWARGNLAVLRLPESPLSRHAGLGWRQRISYLGNLYAYAAGLSRLLLMGLLVTTLAAGILPARISLVSFAVLWLPSIVLAIAASVALCRGHMRSRESSHYILLTAVIFTRALRCALVPSRTKFKVTPKEGADTAGLHALSHLRLVLVLGCALTLAVVWRAAGLLGWIHERPLPQWAALLAIALAVWEVVRIARTTRVVATRHQRRQHVRFDCLASASIRSISGAHEYGRITDIAPSGVGLIVAEKFAIGEILHLEFVLSDFDGSDLAVKSSVVIQSIRANPGGGWRLGTLIEELGESSYRNIVRYCYVSHPFARLREKRLQADRSPSPISIAMKEERDEPRWLVGNAEA